MKSILIPFLILIAHCHCAEEFVTPKTGSFKGVVLGIELLSSYKDNYLVVDLDPRFVLRIKVLSEDSENGKVYVFGIHSPARMMLGSKESAPGKKFNFKFDGKHLTVISEVEPESDKPRKE